MGGFGHGGLVVYRRAVRVAADAFGVVRNVAPEGWPLGRQLVKAASSIPLNIAEGAGEFSAGEKARFYRIARRSAAETAAAYDVATIAVSHRTGHLEVGDLAVVVAVGAAHRQAAPVAPSSQASAPSGDRRRQLRRREQPRTCRTVAAALRLCGRDRAQLCSDS